jgi:hypothetical protein
MAFPRKLCSHITFTRNQCPYYTGQAPHDTFCFKHEIFRFKKTDEIEECHICHETDSYYYNKMSCCGNVVCNKCLCNMEKSNNKNCPYCRTPFFIDEESEEYKQINIKMQISYCRKDVETFLEQKKKEEFENSRKYYLEQLRVDHEKKIEEMNKAYKKSVKELIDKYDKVSTELENIHSDLLNFENFKSPLFPDLIRAAKTQISKTSDFIVCTLEGYHMSLHSDTTSTPSFSFGKTAPTFSFS